MTKEDDLALTRLLRDSFAPLEIIAVNFNKKELVALESVADAPDFFEVYITNPDVGELSVARLESALAFCEIGRTDIFSNSLPRRQALYQPSKAIYPAVTKLYEGGLPVEMMDQGRFHFVYDRNDVEAHRFTNKMIRLLSKMLVNRFAVVDAETGQFIRESGPTHMLKVGPDALECCRQHPHRYLGVGGMRDEDTRLFLAPLPPERYDQLKSARRTPKH